MNIGECICWVSLLGYKKDKPYFTSLLGVDFEVGGFGLQGLEALGSPRQGAANGLRFRANTPTSKSEGRPQTKRTKLNLSFLNPKPETLNPKSAGGLEAPRSAVPARTSRNRPRPRSS